MTRLLQWSATPCSECLFHKEGNTAMHYAMAFRQIAAANALEVLGADVLQENRRGETTTAVAGIGVALASHLDTKRKGKKPRKQNSDTAEWRSSVTDIDAGDRRSHEGKDDDDDDLRRPSVPPPRPSAPPSRPSAASKPSRPPARGDGDGDIYSDDDDDDEIDAASSSKLLVAAAEELAAEEAGSQTAHPPSKPVGGAVRPVRGGASRPVRGGASRPARGGASRPARGGASRPSRPPGASSRATAVLKSVAADLED